MLKGVLFSRDPGGTNALIPIARQLTVEADVQIFNFASSFAIPLWEQSGLTFIPLDISTTKQEIDVLLRRIKPDFVFTGTSEDPTLEGNFWLAAKQQNIFTYSIIDHWTRYKERYILNGIFSPTDLIFTIDGVAKKEMIDLGFQEAAVSVAGQPHFEKFYRYKSQLSRTEFYANNRWPLRKMILFVSDTISHSFPSPIPASPVLGFDEHTILNSLLDELSSIADLKNDFQLVIKLHPKEPKDNFSKLLTARNVPIPTWVLKEGNNMDLIFHSDYVIGMFSMMLFEAFLMNKPVLSLQLNATNPIKFGRYEIPTVVEPVNLKQRLTQFLRKSIQLAPLPLLNSCVRIVETIKSNFSEDAVYRMRPREGK